MPEIERIADQSDPHQRRAREHDAAQPGLRGGQKECRAADRQQRPPARKGAVRIEDRRGCRNQRHAGPRPPIAGGIALVDPAPTAEQHGAGQQFKGPRERQIEGRDRIRADHRHVKNKGRDAENQRHRHHAQSQADGEHQKQRPEQVKLLLDAERPQMQQRLFGGLDVEIAGLQQQRDVGEKSRAGESVAAQLRKGRGQHP